MLTLPSLSYSKGNFLTPFLSHSKVVVISAEITVNELAHYIEELKKYYQVPPDIKVALALSSLITIPSVIIFKLISLLSHPVNENRKTNKNTIVSLIFIFAVMIVSVLTIAMPNVGKIILNNYFLRK